MVEAFLVVSGSEGGSHYLFHGIFILTLGLRIKLSSHPDAGLWWPTSSTLFGCLLFEHWLHRPKIGWLVKLAEKQAKHRAARTAILNPFWTVMVVKKLRRGMRWLKWGVPIVATANKTKGMLLRYVSAAAGRPNPRLFAFCLSLVLTRAL